MNKPIVSRLLMLSGLLLATSLPTYAAISSKIESTALTKAIAHSVIDKNGTVMVAQGAAEDNTNQIARLAFKRTAGKNEAEFAGIAANASAIKNKAISALSLSPSDLPVVAQDDKKVAALTGIENASKAPLVSEVLKTADVGSNVDKPITAVVSTGDYLLAAVNGAGKDGFGDVNSGLALVRVDQAEPVTKLAQIKYDGAAGDKAFKVDVTGWTSGQEDSIGLSDTGTTNNATVEGGSKACMCYDEHLGVVYLGLGHLKTHGSADKKAVALVLAELMDAKEDVAPGMKKIVANPAMAREKTVGHNWTPVVDENSIGATKGNAKDLGVTHVATMHTSTGRDYLVVVNRDSVDTFGVNAVLVMPKDIATDNKSGLMAYDKDGVTTITAGGTTITKTDRKHIVGNDMHFLQHALKPAIGALRVVGDTVYISVQGGRNNTTGNNDEAGIFSSRAIFDKYGAIGAWTPWERAYGFEAKIGTFEVDRRTGQITSVVAAAGTKTITETWTGKVTDRLPKILSPEFNDGIGVLGMFNFDADTPAFKTRNIPTSANNKAKLQEYSLMVATGFGKVALIETGKKDAAHAIVPTVKYEVETNGTKTVNMFNKDGKDAALNALGPIITADLARAGVDEKGYLFVGGKGGVAVLRKDADGKGWNAAAANAMSAFTADMTFLQMKDTAGEVLFANTRKIIATQSYVFIMTDDSLYRVAIDAKNFKTDGIDTTEADNFRTLIGQATTPLTKVTIGGATPFNSSDELYDMMLINNTTDKGVLLVATSQGVFVVGDSSEGVNKDDPSNAPWARVKDTATPTAQDFICGPAFKFELVSAATGGLFTTDGGDFKMETTWLGNVYVTALDKACKKLNVYRLAVGNGNATLIKEPYEDETKNPTEHFYTIGSYNGFARPAYFASEYDFQPQEVDFANHGVLGDFTVSELIPNPALFVQKQPINLNLDISSGLQLAQTVHDATGGITYAYGQFGVRALE